MLAFVVGARAHLVKRHSTFHECAVWSIQYTKLIFGSFGERSIRKNNNYRPRPFVREALLRHGFFYGSRGNYTSRIDRKLRLRDYEFISWLCVDIFGTGVPAAAERCPLQRVKSKAC